MNNKIIVGGSVVLVIILAVFALRTQNVVVYPKVSVDRVVTEGGFGAMPGQELQLPRFKVNGLDTQFNSIDMYTATRTPCAIQSPTEATSTLVFASANFSVSSTTATVVDIGKGTTAFATTTLLGTTYNIAANAQATIVASTTPGQAGDANVFAPGNWLVVKVGGGTGTYSPTGKCKAEFKIVSK